jgi:UDPglucose 6-dehydrogenase
MVKYYNNIYNATLITLANSFYELCQEMGISYSKIKNALVLREHINDSYLQCNENFRGFGGVCLPKDTLAIAKLVEKLNLDVDFFKMILDENGKYKVTVYDGMRK